MCYLRRVPVRISSLVRIAHAGLVAEPYEIACPRALCAPYACLRMLNYIA